MWRDLGFVLQYLSPTFREAHIPQHRRDVSFIQVSQSTTTMTPRDLLLGKTAIITGGTTGIGRAIALEFLKQGCNVAVNHLGLPSDAIHLDSLLEEAAQLRRPSIAISSSPTSISPTSSATIGSLAHLPGDVTDPTTGPALIAFALKTFQTRRLDICVSNAGICTFSDFLDLPNVLYDKTVRTNLDGSFYIIQAAARQMALHNEILTTKRHGKPGEGCSIIAISSISALVGGAQQVHYTPTKAGISSLIQSAAVALGHFGIRCNALLPGTVATQLNEEDLKEGGEKRRYMEGRIPLGRIGMPRDIAGPAVFLACEELSGYVSGAQVLVDGGAFCNFQ